MPEVDFSLLRSAVRGAARRAFLDVTNKHPHEQFYAFALYSDDGAMTIEPACNSEEALRNKASADGHSLIPDSSRWLTGEWAYECEGSEYFGAVYDMLNVEGRNDETNFEAFKARVCETMIQALSDLDAEGFFGAGEKREGVTIFCSISDSEKAERFENESARRLNSATTYENFLNRDVDG